MDVPVLAYAAAAVPETMGGAGIAFAPKDLEYAAELLGALIYDQPLRSRVLAGQRDRAREFGPDCVQPVLQSMLAEVRERCAAMEHPRPDWRDRSAETGMRWWTRSECPCGESGSDGTSTRPKVAYVYGVPYTGPVVDILEQKHS